MRGNIPEYLLQTPRDLDAALRLLREEPGRWQPFAGGTDLMVMLEAGQLRHREFLNILPLKEMQGIQVSAAGIDIGALVTYAEIRSHAVLNAEWPALVAAAAETGGPAIQNRGTIGGNIANASPAADSLPPLLVAGATVVLRSAGGERRIPYSEFHTGYKTTQMQADELITRISLPRGGAGSSHYFRKVGTRRAQAVSKIMLAGLKKPSGATASGCEFRIALGCVAPVPIRVPKTESFLNGLPKRARLSSADLDAAASMLDQEINPIDDIRSDAVFRRLVAANLLREFLTT